MAVCDPLICEKSKIIPQKLFPPEFNLKYTISIKVFQNLQQQDATKIINVIYVKHNLFQTSKWSRTIDLNTTLIILFNSPKGYTAVKLYRTTTE